MTTTNATTADMSLDTIPVSEVVEFFPYAVVRSFEDGLAYVHSVHASVGSADETCDRMNELLGRGFTVKIIDVPGYIEFSANLSDVFNQIDNRGKKLLEDMARDGRFNDLDEPGMIYSNICSNAEMLAILVTLSRMGHISVGTIMDVVCGGLRAYQEAQKKDNS